MDAVIYYNPGCGTCRKTLELLEKNGVKPRVVEYLTHPPSEKELDAILNRLNLPPQGLARMKEPVYAEKVAGRSLTRAQWLKLFHENPVLIERPVVVIGDRAVIARPPEKALDLIQPK
jgi:arsenate reductase